MKIIIIGIQGSGKSTQGKLLSQKLKIPYLSSGHIFRNLANKKDKLGRYIKEHLHAGMLIPDSQALKIISDYLTQPLYRNGFILDGFPRTISQAEKFEHDITHVVYLKVSDKEALWRLSYREEKKEEFREDESLAAIRHRIELFHKLTTPVIKYYDKKQLLREVDGEISIEEIHKEILKKIQI